MRKEKRFYIFIILSLVLHSVLFVLILKPGTGARIRPAGIVYEVDIVPGPPSSGYYAKHTAPPLMPSETAKIKGFGEISKDLPLSERKTRIPSPDIDTMPSQQYQPPQSSYYKGSQDGGPSSGSQSHEGMARAGETWAGIVQARFRQVWQVPEGVPISPGLQSTYIIRISRTGEILSKRLFVSSGNKPYDRSVEMALNRIKLPPPPEGRDEWTLTFIPPYGN